MAEDKNEQQRQALRRRRTLIGMLGSLAFVLVAWAGRQAGLVDLGITGFWLLYGGWLALYGGLFWVVVSGRNLRFRDPSLTAVQTSWAALGPLLLLPLAPELAPVCYLALLVVSLFGAFRLRTRHYLTLNLLLGLAAVAGFAFNSTHWPGIGDAPLAGIALIAFLLALLVMTAVSRELDGYRRVMLERSAQLSMAYQRLHDMAIRDDLTGLHNRRFLMDVLQQQRARHERHPSQTFSVCFVDLDHFKRVNDVFGHAKGDMVLQRFAEVARKAVREEDYVARFGGEEFVLILVGTPEERARLVAERIRRQLSTLTISEQLPDFRITASFGISEHRSGESIDATLARADTALYQAKDAGRDRVVVARGGTSGTVSGIGGGLP